MGLRVQRERRNDVSEKIYHVCVKRIEMADSEYLIWAGNCCGCDVTCYVPSPFHFLFILNAFTSRPRRHRAPPPLGLCSDVSRTRQIGPQRECISCHGAHASLLWWWMKYTSIRRSLLSCVDIICVPRHPSSPQERMTLADHLVCLMAFSLEYTWLESTHHANWCKPQGK